MLHEWLNTGVVHFCTWKDQKRIDADDYFDTDNKPRMYTQTVDGVKQNKSNYGLGQ